MSRTTLEAKQQAEAIAEAMKEMKMEPEEASGFMTKFADAMGKDEFRKLLFDYMDELQDPKYREETTAYLKQLEQDNQTEAVYGKGTVLILPEPVFVIKAREASGRKCLINVCKSDKVAIASIDKTASPPLETPPQRGVKWLLPHSLGPMRVDAAKQATPPPTSPEASSNETCTIHDFVVHPDTIRMSESNPRFKQMLIDTALEAVEKARALQLDRSTLSLPRCTYRGVQGATQPPALAIRSDESGEKQSTLTTHGLVPPVAKRHESSSDEAKAPRSAFSFVKKNDTPTPSSSSSSSSSTPSIKTPSYQIIHRGSVDWSQAWQHVPSSSSITPEHLVIRINLDPSVTSLAQADLTVEGKVLSFVLQGKYSLKIVLPYSVVGDEAKAKFIKEQAVLEVLVPVAALKQPNMEVGRSGGGGGLIQELSGGDEEEGEVATTSSSSSNQDSTPPPPRPASPHAMTDNEKKWTELHRNVDHELSAHDPLVTIPSLPPSIPTTPAPTPPPATTTLPDSLSLDVEFYASSSFVGARDGFYFSVGARGLGYYRASSLVAPTLPMAPAKASSIVFELD